MKIKYTLVPVIISFLITAGCTQPVEKSAEELLEDPKMRNEIYDAVLKDLDYSRGFMEKVTASENCNSPFIQNLTMMKLMCMSKKMDTLMNTDEELMDKMTTRVISRMEEDSAVCDKTCTKMMESERIRQKFGQVFSDDDKD